ncbi:hypothetical protein AAG570_008215 [Ranatra chinensis]|uniref:Cyclin-Q n=1 Tax=Ranatra chinensis TaxID=642074 RepID=A0ABD0XSL8_9HEMI
MLSGYKLKCHPVTIATAATIFHRFFREVDPSGYDKYLIAATALYLAGKARDENHKLRDVINVTHNTLHRGSPPLELKEEYWNRRDAIVQAELLIMRLLKFEITLNNPHKYLLHYLKTLQGWLPRDVWENIPLAQSSFAFLQDFHHSSTVLDYPPHIAAIGCIHLAMQCYGVQVPYIDETEDLMWYNVSFILYLFHSV